MKSTRTETPRVCRCPDCRDAESDGAKGHLDYFKLYGFGCGNCGFYAPLREDESEGYCHKFGIKKQGPSMSLTRRKRGELIEGTFPLIVGSSFYCNEFTPIHAAPAPEDPQSVFWAVKQPT